MSEPDEERSGIDRFYGKFEGVVTDVGDPLKIGRVRARVPAVLGETLESGWALPCAPFGGGKERGMLFLPQVGDTVWIEFAGGDVSRPIWVGTFWGAPDSSGGADDLGSETGAEAPTGEDDAPASATLGVLKTTSGHMLVFDDDGHVVLLANGDGKTSIRFDADGSVVIAADSIKLGKDAQEKVVLGDTFTKLFNSHTHPTGVGPSGPPTQPLTSSHLSTKVTTE
ncbi:MAG: phage baseplate assembly protein V [Solirubrobacteraceae bacterium]